MTEFVEIGDTIINKSSIRRIEVTLEPSNKIIVTCDDGKTLFFPYSNEGFRNLKSQIGIDSDEKSYNYGVSYTFTSRDGTYGFGFECFKGVHEKLTENLIRELNEHIVRSHDLKSASFINVVKLEG